MSSERRNELWRVPVTYAVVGATQADDLLRYPPKGYRPMERRIRIGHGHERWEFAWRQILTWGIQRRAGMRVRPLDTPPAVAENTYVPVTFDDAGEPVDAARTEDAAVFTPSGEPIVRPGDTAILRLALWPFDIPARVVYVIDEPARKGFAYGTLPGHPEDGEEAFLVERRDDDSVWLTIRSISRPANLVFRLGYPLVRLVQAWFVSRYEHALTGRIGAASGAH